VKVFSLTPAIFRAVPAVCCVAAFLFMQTIASAEILEIQYTGLDIVYDGSTISNTGNPDPLESVDFLVDGTKELGLNAPLNSPLSIALSVPGVSNLPVTGGTVTSAAGGTLSLTLPDGDFVNLALGEASVTYVNIDAVDIHFLLAGGAAEVLGQLLPIDGGYGDVVAVSFSTNISTITDDGSYLTSFTAQGAGEIEGGWDESVPEPASITLLLCGLASVLCWRRLK